jgi:hypothetical protein
MKLRRCFALLLLPSLALCSASVARAEDPNMQKAMDAMLGKIGTQEQLKILGHKFNVRKATITNVNGKQVIKGKLSHHLRLRDDDQVHFTITKANGKVEKIDVKVDGSIMQGAIRAIGNLLKDEAIKVLKTDDPPPTTDKKTATAQLETLETALAKVEKLSGDGWEGAAKVILANLALRVDSQGNDTLLQLRRIVRPSGVQVTPQPKPRKR